jgi:hypothetical protein
MKSIVISQKTLPSGSPVLFNESSLIAPFENNPVFTEQRAIQEDSAGLGMFAPRKGATLEASDDAKDPHTK